MGQPGPDTMRIFSQLIKDWRQDRLLNGILKNTSYLFSSNGISMVLAMLQSIFAARLLGVAGVGILGSVTVFATTVKNLLSFRMSELVVKYAGDDIVKGNQERAAALIKVVGLVEALNAVIAYLILFAAAPLAARLFAKDITTFNLFRLYGLYILGSMFSETALGVIQLDKRFRDQAVINLTQSILTAAIIFAAFVGGGGMMTILLAYLIGKLVLGMGSTFLALRSLRRMFGRGWWRAGISNLPDWRRLGRFAISTNLSATVNLVVRDSEHLWVAYFLSPEAAGLYKIGLAVVNLVVMPITPFINTTYPEISRTVEMREWPKLRKLLRRVTMISGGWTLGAGVFLAFFGKWVISLLYEPEFIPAYPVLMVLLLGFGFANVFFWNRPLLLSFGLPMFPFYAMLASGIFKVALAFLIVPRYGNIAEAALLSLYFILSVGLILGRGFKEIRSAELADGLREAV